jgi:hypothetical protein
MMQIELTKDLAEALLEAEYVANNEGLSPSTMKPARAALA